MDPSAKPRMSLGGLLQRPVMMPPPAPFVPVVPTAVVASAQGRMKQSKGRSAFDFTAEDKGVDKELLPSRATDKPADPQESDSDFSQDEAMEMPMQNKAAMKQLLDNMTPEQLQRYELYRRAHLPKPAMKRLLTSLFGQPLTPSTVIVFSGVGKLFVGEMVELGNPYSSL